MNRYYLFGLTILAGLLLSVYYGWAVRPVSATNVTPDLLREDFRADYVLMIAEAYQADADVERAVVSFAFLAEQGQPYNPATFVAEAIRFGTEEGYSVADLALLQDLEQALFTFDPAFAATPTP
jgi:hypothetical protein